MKKFIRYILLTVVIAGIAAGAFCAGRITAPANYAETFYAVIESISENYLVVDGLDVNCINHRGQFHFSIGGDTELIWRYTALSADELDVGDTIAVTYYGAVQESSPAGIRNILKIELLDDEK